MCWESVKHPHNIYLKMVHCIWEKEELHVLKSYSQFLGKYFPRENVALKLSWHVILKINKWCVKENPKLFFYYYYFFLRNNYFFINLIMNVWCFFSGLKSIKKIILKKFGSLFLLILIQNFALFLFYNYIITNLQQLEEDICFILFYNSIIITSGGVRISI